MNTKELKAIIKPLIKQCIKEVLMEEGLGKLLAESVEQPVIKKQEPVKESKVHTENRKKLLDEIGKAGYVNNKFDPFAGTKPLSEAQASNVAGPAQTMDPSDPGIDVSKLIAGNKQMWKTLTNGKKG